MSANGWLRRHDRRSFIKTGIAAMATLGIPSRVPASQPALPVPTPRPALPHRPELSPRIAVVGVGHSGADGIDHMIQATLEGVDYMAVGGDAYNRTWASDDSWGHIPTTLTNHPLVIIVADLGEGANLGLACAMATAARRAGSLLTVGIVPSPPCGKDAHGEPSSRAAIAAFSKAADQVIIIPGSAPGSTAFPMASGFAVQCLSDLVVAPGLISLDFEDIQTVMSAPGPAFMGMGESSGYGRARLATDAAISPTVLAAMLNSAPAILINITGGIDLTLQEIDEIASRIRDQAHSNANIVFGSIVDPALAGSVRVTLIATGISTEVVGVYYGVN